MGINNISDLKLNVLDKPETKLSSKEIGALNAVDKNIYDKMKNEIAKEKFSLKSIDNKPYVGISLKNIVENFDTRDNTFKINIKGKDVAFKVGTGTELGAWIQLYLITNGQPIYNARLAKSGGTKLSIDGNVGEFTKQAIANIQNEGSNINAVNSKVNKVKGLKNVDFYKDKMSEGFKYIDLKALVTAPEVKQYVKEYTTSTGAFNNIPDVNSTSYDNLTVTVPKFGKNKKVGDKKILGSTFIERDGTFNDTKFAQQFEGAIKAMIKEDHESWTSNEKAKEVGKINDLANKINTLMAITDTDLAKVNKELYRNYFTKNQASVIAAEKELNTMKIGYASKELADLKAKMPGYKQKFVDKIAELNRAIDKKAFNANRLANKTDGLIDATDLGFLEAMKSSLKDLNALKTKVAGDVANYTTKDASTNDRLAYDKKNLLTDIDTKIKDAEKRIQYIEMRKADGDKVAQFEKLVTTGKLTYAETKALDYQVDAKKPEYKAFRDDFKTRVLIYRKISSVPRSEFNIRLKKIDKMYGYN